MSPVCAWCRGGRRAPCSTEPEGGRRPRWPEIAWSLQRWPRPWPERADAQARRCGGQQCWRVHKHQQTGCEGRAKSYPKNEPKTDLDPEAEKFFEQLASTWYE